MYLPLSLKYFRWLAIACSTDSSGQILTPLGNRMDRFLRNCTCLWNCSASMMPSGFCKPGGREGFANCQSLRWGAGETSLACSPAAVKLKPRKFLRWDNVANITIFMPHLWSLEEIAVLFSANRTYLWLYKQPYTTTLNSLQYPIKWYHSIRL